MKEGGGGRKLALFLMMKIIFLILTFFVFVSHSAYAVFIPLVPNAANVAGAVFASAAAVMLNDPRGTVDLMVAGAKKTTFFWLGPNTLAQTVYLLPKIGNAVSQHGYQATLENTFNAVKDEIFKNPNGKTLYPNTHRSLDPNSLTPQSQNIQPGQWGYGENYDSQKAPNIGDVIDFPDGTSRTVTRVSGCTTMIPDTSHPDLTNRQRRQVGSSGCHYAGCSVYYIWDGCKSGSVGTDGKTVYGHIYTMQTGGTPSTPQFNIDDYSDDQIREALDANPDEVAAAGQNAYTAEHGTSTNGFPSSGSNKIIDPSTNAPPKASDVVQNVDMLVRQVGDAGSGTATSPQSDDDIGGVAGTGTPTPSFPGGTTETHTTTTTGQSTVTTTTTGQSTVTTNDQGQTVVSTPVTITITDAHGNVVSQSTSTQTTTYEAGESISIPQAGSQTITVSTPQTTTITDADGNVVSQSTSTQTTTYENIDINDIAIPEESTKEETEEKEKPPNLNEPDLIQIDWSPLQKANGVLKNKFPFSVVTAVSSVFDNLASTPTRPDFDVTLFGVRFSVDFSWLDDFALVARSVLGWFVLFCSGWMAFEAWR